MIDKKELISELIECVKDATDIDTQITGLTMCALLMNEVIDQALNIPVVVNCSTCKHQSVSKYVEPCYGCRDNDGYDNYEK